MAFVDPAAPERIPERVSIREDPWAGAWQVVDLGRCEHGRTVRWHGPSGYQRHIDDGSGCEGWIEG